MRRYLALSIVCLLVLTGCSSLSTDDSLQNEPVAKDSNNLINYSSLDYKEGEILVKISNSAALKQLLVDKDSEVVKVLGNTDWRLLTVPAGESTLSFMEELKEEKSVLLVEPNLSYGLPKDVSLDSNPGGMSIQQTSPATNYSKQWGFDTTNAEAAWDITTGDPNVIVAIIGTGVDPYHPEFAEKTFIGNYDATGEGITDVDNNGQGTAVAAIAADNGAVGEMSGVAWDSPLMNIRAQDSNLNTYTSYLTEGLTYLGDYAQAHPEYRMVVNVSLLADGYSFALKDAIDYARDNGVVVIAPVGNRGIRDFNYPASYNGVIAVASSNPKGERSSFSSKGDYVSLGAPGERIYTADLNEEYGYESGSEYAAAYVTGAAALLLANDPILTPLEVQNQLEETAQGTEFSEELGHGILDMEALLGTMKAMKYGSLDVTTNIIPNYAGISPGIVTVFDANGVLKGYGTTGESGNHEFPALTPGDYTVNVSYYDVFKESYDIQTQTVNVNADSTATSDFMLDVPVEVVSNDLMTGYLLGEQLDKTSVEFPMTIVEAGTYQFITKQYQEILVDTVLTIKDVNGNDVIKDYDKGGFENLIINLEPGDYVLIVSDSGEDDVMACLLDIFLLESIY